MTSFAFGTATDVGRVRRTNQDHLLTADPVFVVADGMGGHNGGEVASAIAVDEMANADAVNTLGQLVEVVQQANREIIDQSRLDPKLRGMGTTVVALIGMDVDDSERIGVANVGDSRLYLRTDDELVQLTEDHSLVEALVRDGRLSREDAADHPQRNILTRALGIDDKALVDTWELVPVAGDRYLLCSDGLFNELEPEPILEVLHRLDDPGAAAEELVAAAVAAGGHDNVTVLIVDVVAPDTEAEEPPANRIVGTYKAVPDASFLRDPLAPGDLDHGPSDPHPDEIIVDRSMARSPFVTWRLGLFVAAVLVVLAVLLSSLVILARSSYHVGLDGEEVVIFKGQEGGVLWFDPTVEEPVAIIVAELDPTDLSAVDDGVEFDSLDAARQYGLELRLRATSDPTP